MENFIFQNPVKLIMGTKPWNYREFSFGISHLANG